MILSVTGLQGSGKDTIADYLVKKHNYTQISFAGTLKDILAVIFGWDREMLEGKTKEAREARNVVDKWWSTRLNIPDFTPRKALTLIGTDVLRNHFNDNLWIYCLEKKLTSIEGDIIISDARYLNELNMLKKIGCKTLNVIRGPLPNWWGSALKYNRYSGFEKYVYNFYLKYVDKDPNFVNLNIHSSEWEWIGYNFDYTLYNDKGIEHLYDQVEIVIRNN